MAVATTEYQVKLRYSVDDKTGKGLLGIASKAKKARRQSNLLGRALGMLGGAYLGAKGIGFAAKALIGFNSQMEGAKIQMAGLLKLNLGGEWSRNMKDATHLVEGLQMRAKKSVGTTKDMVEMASMIVRPLAAAGASMQDIEDVTAGATVAAKAFGIEAGMAALDIEGALMGQLKARDRFARALLEPMGYSTKSFNALSATKRLDALRKALKGPAVKAMADAQEKSFAGVTSTLQDNLQIALGKVGLPLMRKITEEVKRWNRWIDENPQKIEHFAKVFSDALVTGFNAVKEVANWVSENKDTLIMLAKAALAMKGVSMASNMLGQAPLVGGALGTLAMTVGTAYITGKLIEAHLEKEKAKEEATGGRQRRLNYLLDKSDEAMRRGDKEKAAAWAKMALADAKKMGIGPTTGKWAEKGIGGHLYRQHSAGAKGVDTAMTLAGTGFNLIGLKQKKEALDQAAINQERLTMALRDYTYSALAAADATAAFKRTQTAFWDEFIAGTFRQLDAAMQNALDPRRKARNPPANVKIKIESVNAADPDRFVMDLQQAIDKANRSPSQAKRALQGGF